MNLDFDIKCRRFYLWCIELWGGWIGRIGWTSNWDVHLKIKNRGRTFEFLIGIKAPHRITLLWIDCLHWFFVKCLLFGAFSSSPSPFGLDFGTLDFGLGLGNTSFHILYFGLSRRPGPWSPSWQRGWREWLPPASLS